MGKAPVDEPELMINIYSIVLDMYTSIEEPSQDQDSDA